MNPLCVNINNIFIKYSCFLKQKARSKSVSTCVGSVVSRVRQLGPRALLHSAGANGDRWPHTDRDWEREVYIVTTLDIAPKLPFVVCWVCVCCMRSLV